MNILRRLPLFRLLLLCGVVVAVGIGATALALAVGTGPAPPAKPLADAVHDALSAPKVDGVSARIQFTNHLLEGANLANSGGEAGQISLEPAAHRSLRSSLDRLERAGPLGTAV